MCNWFLFRKDLDFNLITVLQVSVFTWLFLFGIYNLSKVLFHIFLILHIAVFIPYFIANEMLNGISNSHITALYFTDSAESFSYLKVIPNIYILFSLLIIAPVLYFFKAKLPIVRKKYSWGLILLVCLYSFAKVIIYFPVIKNQLEYTYRTIYISPIRIITKTLGMYDIVKRDIVVQRDLQKLPDSWNVKSSAAEDDVYIIVIGESVRRDFVGIYNPNFKNSPFLKSIPKIQFNNTLSFAGQTMESLSNTFVLDDTNGNTYFPNNVVSLSQKADFEVDWISNQGSIGNSDNFIAAMAKNANFNKFLTRGIGATFGSDDLLLNILKERVMINTPKHKVIFLHLMGSHPSPCDITDGKFNEFVISRDISCYNETIKRTDNFLKEVYSTAKKSNKSFKIMYFADHGLFLNKTNILYHGNQYKQNYEVPLVIIDPTLKENIYINESRNLKDFLFLYSELLNIKTSNLEPTYQFISEEKASNPFRLYDNKDYQHLKDNPIK